MLSSPAEAATLSRAALARCLRGQLGFAGVIFSDDLRMKAIADQIGIPHAACEAIAAGCDVLLVCDEPELSLQVHAALIARAERDGAFVERLRDAAAALARSTAALSAARARGSATRRRARRTAKRVPSRTALRMRSRSSRHR